LSSAERRYVIVRGILDRLTTLSAASKVAFTSELPVTAGGSTSAFTLRTADGVVTAQASPRLVSAGALAALGLRLVEGRDFNDLDTETSAPVTIVNRTFARRYLGDAAVGARLPMGVGYQANTQEATGIGGVDDVPYPTA